MLSVPHTSAAPVVEPNSRARAGSRRNRGPSPRPIKLQILVKLLNEYKKNKCLWDTRHIDYRNNQAKAEAWDNLLAIFQEQYPTADRATIKEKIFQIRQNYVRTRKRVLNAKTPFEPRLWYYRFLSFLSSQIRTRGTGNERPRPGNTTFIKKEPDITDLIQNLPDDQKSMAHTFITEILHRARLQQMLLLKLSVSVNGTDYVLIHNSTPEDEELALPGTSTSTPEEPTQQDSPNTDHSDFLAFAAAYPNYKFNPEVDEIVFEDDEKEDD